MKSGKVLVKKNLSYSLIDGILNISMEKGDNLLARTQCYLTSIPFVYFVLKAIFVNARHKNRTHEKRHAA